MYLLFRDEGTCQDDGVSEAVKTSTCDESDQTAASVDTRPTDDSESVEESKEETNDNATNGKSVRSRVFALPTLSLQPSVIIN